MPDLVGQVDSIEDDVLRLIFLACHPALSPESRAALTAAGRRTDHRRDRAGFLVADPPWRNASRERRGH